MEIKILVQSTPNPNAKKFVINHPVKREGKITYSNQEDCFNNLLAHDLFGIAHVSSLHFFDNIITVTQDGEGDWENLEWLVNAIIETRMPIHNADFKDKPAEVVRKKIDDPVIAEIDNIIDKEIRRSLQMDGGDLEVLAYDKDNKMVVIKYEGACGSCPSATMGTLNAIQSTLRVSFDPGVRVEAVDA